IVTQPSEGEVITVSVTTQHTKSESLVVLQVGDHPFIAHPSVIAYGYSRIRTVEDIENAIRTGSAKQREPVSEALLQRIRSGLAESDFTPNCVRHYFNGLVDL